MFGILANSKFLVNNGVIFFLKWLCYFFILFVAIIAFVTYYSDKDINIRVLELTFSALSATGSIFILQSLKMTNKQINDQNIIARFELHSRFQDSFRELQKEFPNEVNDKDFKEKYQLYIENKTETFQPEDIKLFANYKRQIERYWYFVFDEWFVCKNSGGIFEVQWIFYRAGVKSALKSKDFEERIKYMLKKEFSFLGLGVEFKNEINSILKEIHDENLQI